jgi:DNA-binding GntR family transcriptional regulator
MNLTSEINELRNVAQHIAAKLEAFILDGTIAPGTRLIQTKVAEQFGVSRLPVRDAFAMLIKSELAVALPRKGIMVRPISVTDVHDLFEMRVLIEAAAIRKSAPLLAPADLASARQLIAAQASVDPSTDFAGLLAADERFHRLLWSRCGNQEMDLVLSRIWSRIKLLRAQARGLPEWQKVSVQHHEQILAAIETRHFDEAVALVTAGITRSEQELVGLIERAQGPAR